MYGFQEGTLLQSYPSLVSSGVFGEAVSIPVGDFLHGRIDLERCLNKVKRWCNHYQDDKECVRVSFH